MAQTSTIIAFAGLGISVVGAVVLIISAPSWMEGLYRKKVAVAYYFGLTLVIVGLIVMCVRNEL